jgi:hypothetical protein
VHYWLHSFPMRHSKLIQTFYRPKMF